MYQLQVARSRDLLRADSPDVWDSGKVTTSASVNLEYDGPRLESATRCHWRVWVWDVEHQASAWSEPAWWDMGLLDPDDWTARWIAPADRARGGSYLRGEFYLPAAPVRARVFVTARGSYERGPDGRDSAAGTLHPGPRCR